MFPCLIDFKIEELKKKEWSNVNEIPRTLFTIIFDLIFQILILICLVFHYIYTLRKYSV